MHLDRAVHPSEFNMICLDRPVQICFIYSKNVPVSRRITISYNYSEVVQVDMSDRRSTMRFIYFKMFQANHQLQASEQRCAIVDVRRSTMRNP